MTPACLDLAIVIEAGTRSRMISAGALAEHLHIDAHALRLALLGLLQDACLATSSTASSRASGEPTEGERAETFQEKKLSETCRAERSDTFAHEGEVPALRDTLSKALDDASSRAGLEKLCRAYPKALLFEALRRTQATAPERVRKSRGALFTGIVRRLHALGWTPSHSSSSSPYAFPPSPDPS